MRRKSILELRIEALEAEIKLLKMQPIQHHYHYHNQYYSAPVIQPIQPLYPPLTTAVPSPTTYGSITTGITADCVLSSCH